MPWGFFFLLFQFNHRHAGLSLTVNAEAETLDLFMAFQMGVDSTAQSAGTFTMDNGNAL